MFDNKKFESQVRQKLQELDIRPSASVWDRIEAQLPPENKRRAFPIFWRTLIVAAAASVGGYIFLTTKTDSHKVNNSTLIAKVPVNNTVVKENKALSAGPEISSGADMQNEPVEEKSQSQSLTDSHNNQSVSDNNKLNRAKNILRPSSRHSEGIPGSSKSRNSKISGFLLNDGSEKPQNLEGLNTPNPEMPEFKPSRLDNREISPSMIDGTVSYHNTFKVNADIKQLDAPAETPVKIKNNKRWSFELNLSGGQSIYSDGKVDKLFTSAQQTVLNYQGATPPGNNLTAAPPPTPSEIKPGKSFSIGLNTRYRISGKLSVTAGVNYNLLTTKISTGTHSSDRAQVDINGVSRQVSGYYNAGSANDYSNNYHFIEIPVLMHYQFNKGKKLPLLVHGGLSFARLIKTNILHFDNRAGIYYKANELVKRNFLNIEGGVSATLFANRKFPLTVGPEIQYGLTNLFTGRVPENNKHSLFIGVKAAMPLPF